MDNQLQEADKIAEKLWRFYTGAFVVGGVAYDPNAVKDKIELEVIAVIENLRNAPFAGIQKELGMDFNPAAVKSVSQGQANVFDIHYNAEGGFPVGVYFRDAQAHRDVCNLGGFRRFTDRDKVPRTCTMRSLDGEQRVFDESEGVEGGKVYAHHAVLERDGELWLGFPAINILMTPTIIRGKGPLGRSFQKFEENLKSKLHDKYNLPHMDLTGAIPEHFERRMPDNLRQRLENYQLI